MTCGQDELRLQSEGEQPGDLLRTLSQLAIWERATQLLIVAVSRVSVEDFAQVLIRQLVHAEVLRRHDLVQYVLLDFNDLIANIALVLGLHEGN